MEKQMNDKYREIAETVNEMIPEAWEEFHFYAQISETGGGTYFFFNTPEDTNDYFYSLEIPYNYDIDKEAFENKEIVLFDLSEELREIFRENDQDLWFAFTVSLDSSGKLKVHYDYMDWFATDYSFSDLIDIWKYKYLGTEPQNQEERDLIDKYLNEFPDNPI